MSLPEKNRICGFCKHSKPTSKANAISCSNREAIFQRRSKIYARAGITLQRGHSDKSTWTMFRNRTCKEFEERSDAKKELIAIKMKGEYRSWYHEVAH